jgi:hypothetical protein
VGLLAGEHVDRLDTTPDPRPRVGKERRTGDAALSSDGASPSPSCSSRCASSSAMPGPDGGRQLQRVSRAQRRNGQVAEGRPDVPCRTPVSLDSRLSCLAVHAERQQQRDDAQRRSHSGSPRSAEMGGAQLGVGHKVAGAAWPRAWTSAFARCGRLGRGAATRATDDEQACWLILGALLLWMAKRERADPAPPVAPGPPSAIASAVPRGPG